MRTIDSVRIDTRGFDFVEADFSLAVWQTANGDLLDVSYSPEAPDAWARLTNLDEIRVHVRKDASNAGNGMISVDLSRVDGCTAIKIILKKPQMPSGMTYIGFLFLPFREFAYGLRARCAEVGMTGTREAAVLDQMLGKGLIKISKEDVSTGRIPNWMRDPYDSTVEAPLMWNPSEAEEYDVAFPTHPLSRARRLLRHLETTTVVAPKTRAAPAPRYSPSRSASQPWWKVW